jgi:hypothetical protein
MAHSRTSAWTASACVAIAIAAQPQGTARACSGPPPRSEAHRWNGHELTALVAPLARVLAVGENGTRVLGPLPWGPDVEADLTARGDVAFGVRVVYGDNGACVPWTMSIVRATVGRSEVRSIHRMDGGFYVDRVVSSPQGRYVALPLGSPIDDSSRVAFVDVERARAVHVDARDVAWLDDEYVLTTDPDGRRARVWSLRSGAPVLVDERAAPNGGQFSVVGAGRSVALYASGDSASIFAVVRAGDALSWTVHPTALRQAPHALHLASGVALFFDTRHGRAVLRAISTARIALTLRGPAYYSHGSFSEDGAFLGLTSHAETRVESDGDTPLDGAPITEVIRLSDGAVFSGESRSQPTWLERRP